MSKFAAAMRHPHLLIYLIGNTASVVGTWAQRTVIYWMAWQLTESTAVLGLLASADILPALLVSPIAGSLADRIDRLVLARHLQLLSVLPPAILTILMAYDRVTIENLLIVSATREY